MVDAPGLDFAGERDGYRYVPLRREHVETLRTFRNAQMDVLRQSETISPEQQQRWFDEVVVPAQREAKPPMVLISILDDSDRFVGYGGLVHIDWEPRRAEVSFLVAPERVAHPDVYRRDMTSFLAFLTDLAFDQLMLNRLCGETFAFREFHIRILEEAGFVVEGRLREHVMTGGRIADSLMHGLLATDPRP